MPAGDADARHRGGKLDMGGNLPVRKGPIRGFLRDQSRVEHAAGMTPSPARYAGEPGEIVIVRHAAPVAARVAHAVRRVGDHQVWDGSTE